MDKVLECKVIKIENEKILKDFKEVIVREYPLTIILNGKKLEDGEYFYKAVVTIA